MLQWKCLSCSAPLFTSAARFFETARQQCMALQQFYTSQCVLSQGNAICREASAGLAGAGNKSAGAAVHNTGNDAGCAGGSGACRCPSIVVLLR